MSSRDRAYLPLLAAIAASYLATAKVGFSMAFVAEQVTVVWPPSGIALAAALLFGYRVWPGIWVGAFLANFTSHESIPVAAAIATGNTLEAVVGTWLLQRIGKFDLRLSRTRDVLALAGLAAGSSTILAASIGSLSLCAGGVQPWAAFVTLWRTWWLGDAMGDLVVAPAVIACALAMRAMRWRPHRILEGLLVLGGLGAVCQLAFGYRFAGFTSHYPLGFMVFPFLIWAAVRFGALGYTTAILIASIVAIWGTVRGVGPFAGESTHESLVLVQVFMSVVALTTLLLGAAITDRRITNARRSVEHSVAREIASAGSLEEAIPRILEVICTRLDWDLGDFWRVDQTRNRLECLDLWHRPQVQVPRFESTSRATLFESGVGLPGRVWATGKPAWIPDVTKDANFPRRSVAIAEGLHGAFGFPILLEGDVLGVLEFFSREVRMPDPETLRSFEISGNDLGQFIGRKRIETSLREGEARLRAVLDAALDCIVGMDGNGDVREFNPAAEATFGIPRAQAIGKSLADLILPERLRAAHREGLARYRRTGERRFLGRRIQMPAMRSDGSEFPVELTITVIQTRGEPLFTAFIRDITESRRSEEALRRSEERFRSILDNAPLAVSIKDPHGRYVFVNRSSAAVWEEISGGRPVLGRTDHDLLPKEAADRSLSEDSMVVQAMRPLQFEETTATGSGTRFWLTNKFPLFDPSGALYALCAISAEITEHKHAAEALKIADRRKDEFLAMLAHELRNPLAPLRSAVEILRLLRSTDSNLEYASGVIDRQTVHLARLVDDLLDAARITTGKINLRSRPIEIAEVIARALELSRPLIERRRHELRVQMPDEPVRLNADLDRISQAVGNLLNNAAKYTEDEGVISLTVERRASDILIRVKDTGIGIPPETLPVIFDLFAQGDRSLTRSGGGLGIGLTLVRQLVEAHGGSVQVFSEGAGLGSEFVVTLAACDAPPSRGHDTD